MDLWAAAICLYEMLSGKQVHAGLSAQEIAARAGSLRVAPLRPERDGVNPELAAVLSRMLHARPSRRPATAAEAYRTLNAFAHRAEMLLEPDTLARFVLATTVS